MNKYCKKKAMEDKLVTIIVLPYSKAQILKSKLEEEGIECVLEDLNVIEGSASFSVKVKIREVNVRRALPLLDEFIGKKPVPVQEQSEESERHILVPVDFSPVSFKVSKTAFNIAGHLNVKLVFMHCYVNPVVHSIPYSDIYTYDATLLLQMEDAEKEARTNLRRFITDLSDNIGREKWKTVASEFIVKAGYADEDILAYANKNNSQLIVMGTGKGKQKKVVGSITADIIYNAEVPVLVIPEESPVKGIDEIRRVLYATNFDEKDFAAIDKLINLLKPFDVQVICVHAGKDDRGKEWNTAKLEGMKDILKRKYTDKEFDCRLIIGEDIPETIENFIREEDIDILSLTTHKRNMISRLFNPSFARKMVFHTHTPLLVFHA
ncbi:MAG: universal stress protein [Prolixibacteraceae bacterium]